MRNNMNITPIFKRLKKKEKNRFGRVHPDLHDFNWNKQVRKLMRFYDV